MRKIITKEAKTIKKYLKELIKDYCYECFDIIEADYILKKKLNKDKLDELAVKLVAQIMNGADTTEKKFKTLTGIDITEVIKW